MAFAPTLRAPLSPVALLVAALASAPAAAQGVADFYRGKTIEMMIGGAVGGGYDLAGRTVANHIGRHIPGNPGFVVRNMPGATSLIMTNHLYNVARRDGTVIGSFSRSHRSISPAGTYDWLSCSACPFRR